MRSPASSTGTAPASDPFIEFGGGPKPSQPTITMLAATMATIAHFSIFFTYLSSAPTPVGALNVTLSFRFGRN